MNEKIEFSRSEEAYRRGFHQGFFVGRNNEDVTEQEVREWRYGDEEVCAPGTGMAGHKLDGLKKDEEHRFFLNRVKENWNA